MPQFCKCFIINRLGPILACCALISILGGLQPLVAQGDNFRFGAIRLDLKGITTVTHDDNISASGLNPRKDIIIEPGLDLAGHWRVTEINTLKWNIGAGYRKYLKNSQLDSKQSFISLSPDSKTSFTIIIDNITIEVSDKFSYEVDATDSVAIDSSGNQSTDVVAFERFNNEFAIDADWNLNRAVIGLGIRRIDIIPKSERFKQIQRTEHQVILRGTMILSKSWIVGAFASVSDNRYKENFQNNSRSYSFGPSAQYQYSPLLIFSFDSSYTISSFQTGGGNQDSSQPKSIGFRFGVKHIWSRSYEHSLGLTRYSSFGFVSNSRSTNQAEYSWTWKAFKWSDLSGSVSYSNSRDSGGITPEKFNRYGATIGIGYTLNKRTTLGLSYAYTKKSSNIAERSYPRKRVIFKLNYDF